MPVPPVAFQPSRPASRLQPTLQRLPSQRLVTVYDDPGYVFRQLKQLTTQEATKIVSMVLDKRTRSPHAPHAENPGKMADISWEIAQTMARLADGKVRRGQSIDTQLVVERMPHYGNVFNLADQTQSFRHVFSQPESLMELTKGICEKKPADIAKVLLHWQSEAHRIHPPAAPVTPAQVYQALYAPQIYRRVG